MALLKKKNKEKIPDNKPNATEVFKFLDDSYRIGREWAKDTGAEKAYEYYQSNQKPESVDLGNNYWVMLNRIRDQQKTKLGILATSPPVWKVTGRGKDSMDRERIKYWRYMMRWMAKESRLYQAVNHALFDYLLIEYAYIRLEWDKYFDTSMGTKGMAQAHRLNPFMVFPDYRAREQYSADAQCVDFLKRVSREQFIDEFYNRLTMERQKSIDVDKIFKEIEDKNHFDYQFNSGQPSDQHCATVVQHDYWLNRKIEKELDDIGKLTLYEREYRIAMVAGNQILHDWKSDLDDMNSFTLFSLAGMPMLDSPYPSSDFQAQRDIQDLINTMLSMTINSQARQMSSPWMAVEGAISKPMEKLFTTSGSDPNILLKWRYTKEMLAAGIPVEAARPKRVPPGQMDTSWFQVLDWVKEQFQDISVKDVLRGENPAGIKSGKHVQLLQAAGMQPAQFNRQSLEDPLARIGQAMYQYAKQYLTDEFEIPIDDENAGEEQGVVVNQTLDRAEIREIVELGQTGNEVGMAEKLALISIRKGDERLTLNEYFGDVRSMIAVLNNPQIMEDDKAELVRRDLSFGNFNVGLTIDPTAELTKAERIERSTMFMELMSNMGATKTALKYGMKIAQEPDINQIMKDVEEELAEKGAMMQGMGGQQ